MRDEVLQEHTEETEQRRRGLQKVAKEAKVLLRLLHGGRVAAGKQVRK